MIETLALVILPPIFAHQYVREWPQIGAGVSTGVFAERLESERGEERECVQKSTGEGQKLKLLY